MSKDARCQARHYYQSHGRDFTTDYAALMSNHRAVLVWLPQLVVMMMPVSSAQLWEGVDLALSPLDADAWYVHLLVGDFNCACQLAQAVEPLSLLCFQRGGRNADYHLCNWARFTRVKPKHTTKKNTIMGFMSTSTTTTEDADPPVTTVGASDSYNTEQVYDAKTSKRKGLLSTILSKSSSSSSSSVGGSSSTLG